jgi:hypothetical protein
MTTAATATTDDDEGHHRHSHTHRRASYVVSTSVPHAQVSKTDEHILATLFILCPEALMCIGSSERHVENPTTANDEEGQRLVN